MGLPAVKEEFRPETKEVVERLMEDSRFEGYMLELVESFLDGSRDEQVRALQAFGTLAKQRASNVEQALIEEHFDQKDF